VLVCVCTVAVEEEVVHLVEHLLPAVVPEHQGHVLFAAPLGGLRACVRVCVCVYVSLYDNVVGSLLIYNECVCMCACESVYACVHLETERRGANR
jgi:hypothetical protein